MNCLHVVQLIDRISFQVESILESDRSVEAVWEFPGWLSRPFEIVFLYLFFMLIFKNCYILRGRPHSSSSRCSDASASLNIVWENNQQQWDDEFAHGQNGEEICDYECEKRITIQTETDRAVFNHN